MSTLQPGQIVGDRYELGRLLGTGGMADVFLAYDRMLDREVAVKVLSQRYAADPAFVERFRREASAAASLNHPNIVSVFDRGETNGSYYIVMELLDGPDLKQVIRTRGPLPPVEAIDHALQVLAALGAAHRRDVIHRDVKPQNVMLAADGRLKVTDFGIARAGDHAAVTEAGSVIGTAQYLSPEQARGEDVTAASDCYSLGIVLYEMLTGRVPFDAEKPVAVAMMQINETPIPPRVRQPSIPDALNRVVMRSLEKRPASRYRTADEFAQALLQVRALISGDGPTHVMPAAAAGTGRMPTQATMPLAARRPPPPPADPAGGRRWVPWLVAALFVLVAAGGAAAFLLRDGGGGTVTIPDVSNLSAKVATDQLEAEGLTVDRQTRSSDTVPEGDVIRTAPPAGEEVDEGATVTIVVSSGRTLIPVPNVVGDIEEDARVTLQKDGFEVRVRTEASDTVDEGRVISQNPAAASEQATGSSVVIIVSSGPAPVEVPNVQLKDLSEATSLLENAGLRVGDVSEREGSTRDPNTVLEQSPRAGQEVDKGATVDLVIAAEPADVEVPEVVGMSAADAQQALIDAGFRVTSEGAPATSGEPADQVIGQDPPAGTPVAPGSRVVIIVSLGPTDTTAVPPPGDGGGG